MSTIAHYHPDTWEADAPDCAQWQIRGSRPIYESRWVSLNLVDVEPPSAEAYQHHVIRLPHHSVFVVVHHPEHGVLLLYRHRFITDTTGFEVPAGGIEPGETPVEAAAREVLEETGWRVDEPRVFATFNASNGLTDQQFHLAYARAVECVGPPQDTDEADQLYWVAVPHLARLVHEGRIPCCPSSLALLYTLTGGLLTAGSPS
jgi:8-oxo-dGTP pyrophosphatase MutT (NUDIX family)